MCDLEKNCCKRKYQANVTRSVEVIIVIIILSLVYYLDTDNNTRSIFQCVCLICYGDLRIYRDKYKGPPTSNNDDNSDL